MSRRKHSPVHRYALALWALAIVGGLAVALWHVTGWALATAAVGAGAYLLGRRQAPARRIPARKVASIRATAPAPAARQAADAALLADVAEGLAGLGWTKTAARQTASAALAAVQADPAATADVSTVLRRALASAAPGRAERIAPSA
jgi:hypothetical protein